MSKKVIVPVLKLDDMEKKIKESDIVWAWDEKRQRMGPYPPLEFEMVEMTEDEFEEYKQNYRP